MMEVFSMRLQLEGRRKLGRRNLNDDYVLLVSNLQREIWFKARLSGVLAGV